MKTKNKKNLQKNNTNKKKTKKYLLKGGVGKSSLFSLSRVFGRSSPPPSPESTPLLAPESTPLLAPESTPLLAPGPAPAQITFLGPEESNTVSANDVPIPSQGDSEKHTHFELNNSWDISKEKQFDKIFKYRVLKCKSPINNSTRIIAIYDVNKESLGSYYKNIMNIGKRVIVNMAKLVPFVAVGLIVGNPPGAAISLAGSGIATALWPVVVGLAKGVSFFMTAASWGFFRYGFSLGSSTDSTSEIVDETTSKIVDEKYKDTRRFRLGNWNYQKAWKLNDGFLLVESIAKTFVTQKFILKGIIYSDKSMVDHFSTCANATADVGWLTNKKEIADVTLISSNNARTGSRLYGGTDGRKLEYDLFKKYKGIFLCYDMKTKTFYKYDQGEVLLIKKDDKTEVNVSCVEDKGDIVSMTDVEQKHVHSERMPKELVNHACGISNVFGFNSISEFKEQLEFVGQDKTKLQIFSSFLCSHSLPHRLLVGDPEKILTQEVVEGTGINEGYVFPYENVVEKLINEALYT